MTDEQRVAADGFPWASWAFIGIFIVAFWGIVAYAGQDSVAAGWMIGGFVSLLVLGALALWQRAQGKHPVPAAEYLAVVWLLSYVALATLDAVAEDRIPPFDWLVLLPPLSFIPPLARLALGDDGEPRGTARTAAYYSHQVLGVLFCGLGVLFIITVLLVIAAPLTLVPGIMHLRAGYMYRQERGPKPKANPRRGFMDTSR